MATTGRSCDRCGNKLTKARLEKVARKRKKLCGRCEPVVRREHKAALHDRRVVTTFGIRPGDYQRLFDAQGGKCAVYKCTARGITKFLAVEHNHKCDQGHDPAMGCRHCVRGLMCAEHNGWLAKSGDDPMVFLSLYFYLLDPPARKVLNGDQDQEDCQP